MSTSQVTTAKSATQSFGEKLDALLINMKSSDSDSKVKFKLDGRVYSPSDVVVKPIFIPSEVFRPGQIHFELLMVMHFESELEDGSELFTATPTIRRAVNYVPYDYDRGMQFVFSFNPAWDDLIECGYIMRDRTSGIKVKAYFLTRKGKILARNLAKDYSQLFEERRQEIDGLPRGWCVVLNLENQKVYVDLVNETTSLTHPSLQPAKCETNARKRKESKVLSWFLRMKGKTAKAAVSMDNKAVKPTENAEEEKRRDNEPQYFMQSELWLYSLC